MFDFIGKKIIKYKEHHHVKEQCSCLQVIGRINVRQAWLLKHTEQRQKHIQLIFGPISYCSLSSFADMKRSKVAPSAKSF